MAIIELINAFLKGGFNHLSIDYDFDYPPEPLYFLQYNDCIIFDNKEDHQDSLMHLIDYQLRKNILRYQERKSKIFSDLELEIKSKFHLEIKEYGLESAGNYLKTINELLDQTRSNKAYVENYFKNEHTRLNFDEGDPYERIFMDLSAFNEYLVEAHSFHVDMLERLSKLLNEKISSFPTEREPMYHLDLTDRLLIIGLLQEEKLFPNFNTSRGQSKSDLIKFIAYLLNENINSIDTAYKKIDKILNTEKATAKQLPGRLEKLNKIYPILQIIDNLNINHRLEEIINKYQEQQ